MEPLYLPQDLGMVLNSYCNNQRTVKVQCLLTEFDFDKEITSEKKSIDEYLIKNISKGKKSKNFIHNFYQVSDSETKEDLGKFHSLQHKDGLYVFSGESANFFKIVLKIIRKLYPSIISAFIHSNGIYKILENFETVSGISLSYKDAVKKQIFGFAPRTEREWEISKEGRVYASFREAFKEARDNELWIDTIKVFEKNSSMRPKIQFSISRKGLISIERGIFDTYFSNILHPIIEISKERHEQFKHRSRSEQPDKKPKPLIIKFEKKVFEKEETRKEFSKIMKKYSNCNYSIIHSGNPHVYLSILDRNDNSSLSVRTYGEDSLLLIPQIKTSALSLMRFSEFLVSSFYEGVIQNFDQKKTFSRN